MAKMLYFLVTFLESILSVFGIRSTFETAPYRVVATLSPTVEVRTYGPSVVVETDGGGDGFSRLFRYIAGANRRNETIAMTTPVEERGAAFGRVPPSGDASTMRFVLPAKVSGDPPQPDDPGLRISRLPERTLAAIRFSGRLDGRSVEAQAAKLRGVLAAAGRTTVGAPYVLGYDPPFTLPFLRRNEVAIDLAP